MIPFAILSCQIEECGQKNQEVRILDLSEEGFTFRLARELREENAEGRKFHLRFFCFEESQYREVRIYNHDDYELETEEKQEFYTVYRLTTGNMEYQRNAEILMKEYMNYISLKLNEDDAELSKKLTGYPAEMEDIYAENFSKQKEKWFLGLNHETCANREIWSEKFELAVSADNPAAYKQYLKFSLREFVTEYWKKNNLTAHPLAEKNVECLYIGNQFCHLLFPEEAVLFDILEKTRKELVKPVVVFTYMQERYVSFTERLLEHLAQWCSRFKTRLELVVNDWGMLSMIRENKYECFDLTLGILLQKRRKDVRMQYKKGFNKYEHMLEKNTVQAPFYQKYLRDYFGITRISYESCGYPVKIASGKASLHLPFFQMNTSQHCTLYARCHNGERSRQTAVKSCPGYCRDQVFLYPEMLHMIGRYNSLFGYDKMILADGKILQSYLKQGVDRVVMELL